MLYPASDRTSAAAAFQAATRMDPQLVDAWMLRTRIALAQGDQPGATAILSQGLEDNPDSALLRQSRGNLLVQFDALEPALEELNEAARLSPDEPSILIDIAAIHTLRGDNEKALIILREAPSSRSPMAGSVGWTRPRRWHAS